MEENENKKIKSMIFHPRIRRRNYYNFILIIFWSFVFSIHRCLSLFESSHKILAIRPFKNSTNFKTMFLCLLKE